MRAYRAGGITIVNAPGVADDKAVYVYTPEIEFYFGEKAILPNVPTWRCGEADHLAHVMSNLEELVVKEVHGSGGYGMLIGPKSSRAEREAYAKRIEENPAGFIAQPTLSLSTSPTLAEGGIAPRHVDFRPFVITGQQTQLIPGGLTRVALREGSLVVTSRRAAGSRTPGFWTEGPEMLSRTAEGLFWLSRYIERAENIARLLDAGRRLRPCPPPP